MSDGARTRVLGAGDEAALEAFLLPRADTSMFLRANARAAGLVDQGATFQGSYVAELDDAGGIVGVAAHYWNGVVVTQAAPERVGELARLAVARSQRAVAGLLGPYEQIVAARAALGLAAAPEAKHSCEVLFTLDLAELRVPEALARGALGARVPTPADLELTVAWRVDYLVEAMGATRDAEQEATVRRFLERLHGERNAWLLLARDVPVAYTAFNARLPDVVQVGGVWTPPAWRSRGYGRASVAASLLEARAGGVERAILFTDQDNRAAQAAYRALGFAAVGEYGIIMLR